METTEYSEYFISYCEHIEYSYEEEIPLNEDEVEYKFFLNLHLSELDSKVYQ